MGNTLNCEKCSPVANSSVFTFSKDLVLKVSEGKEPKPLSKAQLDYLDNIEDQEIFEQLKCIDDKHSKAYGLTPSRVNFLLDHVEDMVDEITVHGCICCCGEITKCYNTNKECSIKCDEKVKEYEQCIQDAVWEKLFPKPVEKCN